MKLMAALFIVAVPLYLFTTESGERQLERLMEIYYGDPSQNPKYAESRFRITAGSREIESVLFARMKPWDECQQWIARYQDDVRDSCPDCEFTKMTCDANPKKRYLRMLEDKRSHTTYLSMSKPGEAFRKAVLVFWGLTADEAAVTCENLRRRFTTAPAEVLEARCI